MWRGQVNDSRANYEFQSFKCAIRLCPVCADLCPSMAICSGLVLEFRPLLCDAVKHATVAPLTTLIDYYVRITCTRCFLMSCIGILFLISSYVNRSEVRRVG